MTKAVHTRKPQEVCIIKPSGTLGTPLNAQQLILPVNDQPKATQNTLSSNKRLQTNGWKSHDPTITGCSYRFLGYTSIEFKKLIGANCQLNDNRDFIWPVARSIHGASIADSGWFF